MGSVQGPWRKLGYIQFTKQKQNLVKRNNWEHFGPLSRRNRDEFRGKMYAV